MYDFHDWTFMKVQSDKVAKMQTSIINMKLTGTRRNEWIQNITKLEDVSGQVAKLKWKFIRHNTRCKGEKTNKTILTGTPWEYKDYR